MADSTSSSGAQPKGQPTLHHLSVRVATPPFQVLNLPALTEQSRRPESPGKDSRLRTLPLSPTKLTITPQDSQSQRILWLLEELAIPYTLINYKRDEQKRSPPGLKTIHPLGRAPTFITADGRILTESMTIATYLLETYDVSKKFAYSDWIRDMTLTSFSGTSLLDLADTELLFDLAAKHTPWPLSYITRFIKKKYDSFFSAAEFKKNMEFLAKELGDEEWFNGKEPGRADFMLSWPMDFVGQRGYVDLKKDFPTLHAWRMRIIERPAWKSTLEKGNGYDLNSW